MPMRTTPVRFEGIKAEQAVRETSKTALFLYCGMKPVEYCLDEILKKQVERWNHPNPTPDLDHKKLIEDFEIPLGRHEFYKSLIKKLIKDGYVEWLEPKPSEPIEINKYSERSWLTAEGYYFITDGGYTQLKANVVAENKRLEVAEQKAKANRTFLTWLTASVSVGTLVAAWYYGIEIWKYYYHSCK